MNPPAPADGLRMRAAGGRAFAGGGAEAPTFAHGLAEAFPFFGRHVATALFHATAEIGAAGVVPSMPAEQDAAQGQKSKCGPEGELAPAEQWRQQPIPQAHHQFAADEGK